MVTREQADAKIAELKTLRKKMVDEVNRLAQEIVRVEGAIVGIEMLFKEPEPKVEKEAAPA
jgi:hypothetical protein